MNRKTWFGTRGMETWIPTPATAPDYGRSGYSTRSDLANGGAGVRESKNAHNTYALAWNNKSRADVRIITDFADGVYDLLDGVNLIYYLDPMARDQNVLPQAWATPSLACEDATPLITDANGVGRPTASPMPGNGARYPARAALYHQTSTSLTLQQYIPVPPGYSAWVGVHGDSSAQDRIYVQRVNGYTNVGSPVLPTVLGASSTLVNTEFNSSIASGIVLGFVDVVGSPVDFTLYGLIVQVLPIGQTPVDGDFISGQGNAGCQFVGKPAKTPVSAKIDRVSVTARLEETGMDL